MIAGLTAFPEFAPYATSKHAVVGLARTAAAEYAGRIRINTINPSTTDTPMVARFTGKYPELQVRCDKEATANTLAEPK